jgi:NAD(P)-dependent dehydrogenase (short-subunit alcohol dehydrogenase family)
MRNNVQSSPNSPSLRDQHVVILGGSSGVGYATAKCALAEGAKVTIASNHAARVEAALARLGPSAKGGVVDVRNEASIADFFKGFVAFDHLLYMIADSGPHLLSTSLTRRDSTAAARALRNASWGALTAIKYAQSRMSTRGSIVLTDRTRLNLSSAQSVPFRVFDHMTRSLAVDLAPLRVNAVRSDCRTTGGDVESEFLHRNRGQLIPRSADPVEIAQAYLNLLRGSYTTGQVLVVDGGRTLL